MNTDIVANSLSECSECFRATRIQVLECGGGGLCDAGEACTVVSRAVGQPHALMPRINAPQVN